MARKTGRPAVAFTDEMIDAARELLGRSVYPSRAVDGLMARFAVGRDSGWRLVAEARRRVTNELAGRGVDPLTALYLFFESVVADQSADLGHRLAAANSALKLLGLKRVTDAASGREVDAFLARLLQIQRPDEIGQAAEPASNSSAADIAVT